MAQFQLDETVLRSLIGARMSSAKREMLLWQPQAVSDYELTIVRIAELKIEVETCAAILDDLHRARIQP